MTIPTIADWPTPGSRKEPWLRLNWPSPGLHDRYRSALLWRGPTGEYFATTSAAQGPPPTASTPARPQPTLADVLAAIERLTEVVVGNQEEQR